MVVPVHQYTSAYAIAAEQLLENALHAIPELVFQAIQQVSR